MKNSIAISTLVLAAAFSACGGAAEPASVPTTAAETDVDEEPLATAEPEPGHSGTQGATHRAGPARCLAAAAVGRGGGGTLGLVPSWQASRQGDFEKPAGVFVL